MQFIVSAAPYKAITDESSQNFIECSNIARIVCVVGWTIQVGQP